MNTTQTTQIKSQSNMAALIIGHCKSERWLTIAPGLTYEQAAASIAQYLAP